MLKSACGFGSARNVFGFSKIVIVMIPVKDQIILRTPRTPSTIYTVEWQNISQPKNNNLMYLSVGTGTPYTVIH